MSPLPARQPYPALPPGETRFARGHSLASMPYPADYRFVLALFLAANRVPFARS